MSAADSSEDAGAPTAGSASAPARDGTMTQCVWFLSGQMVPGEPLRHVPINCSPFRIGRRPTLNLCLPCNAVSSVHAEIVNTGGQLELRDLGSTNGTFVNGTRVLEPVPLRSDDIVQIADVVLRVQKESSVSSSQTVCADVYDKAFALVQFDRLMVEQSVVPHYQPIVTLDDAQVVAYEVLGRSRILGLETPAAMFGAAARLNLEIELSRMFRWKGIQASTTFPKPPHLFVNTHPLELEGEGLYESMRAIRELTSTQEITLEIHEAAVTSPERMTRLRAVLDELNIGLAYDDFGAGQTRLVELIEVRPDYLKFDMSLVRDIHEASLQRQQMIASLVQMVRELDVVPLAEGVECEGESTVCSQLGFEMAQGFLFGRPAPV